MIKSSLRDEGSLGHPPRVLKPPCYLRGPLRGHGTINWGPTSFISQPEGRCPNEEGGEVKSQQNAHGLPHLRPGYRLDIDVMPGAEVVGQQVLM